MNFATKLAQTRVYTTTNQGGVDSQEVYNEAILQSLDAISPTGGNTNTAEANVVVGSGSVAAGFVSVSFVTDAAFVGTILGATIAANTTINITAETGALLTGLLYTITAGSMTILTLDRP
jgi:hypothetical protein